MEPASFTPTSDLALFFSDPGDRIQVRRRFCFWQSKAGVHGSIAWGKPDEHDVADMCEVFDAQMASPLAKWPSIVDVRAVEALSVIAFESFVRTLAERRNAWHPRAGRQAIVHGGGFTGALILGAVQIGAAGYDVAAFEDHGAALAWVGAPRIATDYTLMRTALIDPPDVVRRVRAALEAEDRPVTVEALARRLGMSTRSLQRELGAAGTSMRSEQGAHIVARAERLLEGTDFDLAAISAMVGLRSPGRLVSLFRRVRKTTPGAWRRAAR